MRIWITGVSGYIGTRLTQVCDSDGEIESLTGTDIVPPKVTSKKLNFIQADINDPTLADKVRHGAPDVAIHLAFILNPIHDVSRMEKVNVGGTRNFLQAVDALKIRKILVASSATAYGAHADNPMPLDETHPVRGDLNKNYPYSEHKAIIDRMCQEFAKSHPQIEVVIVRPTIVIGPNISNYIGRMISQPRGFTIKGANPPMQFVHEEDVARAFHFLLKKGQAGAYNLTGDGTLTMTESAALAKSRTLEFPFGVAYSLIHLFWLLHLKPVESQAGVLNFFRYPWVISNDKIKKLGFTFEHSSRDALTAFLKAQGRLAS